MKRRDPAVRLRHTAPAPPTDPCDVCAWFLLVLPVATLVGVGIGEVVGRIFERRRGI